jgi:hypothetical protein
LEDGASGLGESYGMRVKGNGGAEGVGVEDGVELGKVHGIKSSAKSKDPPLLTTADMGHQNKNTLMVAFLWA